MYARARLPQSLPNRAEVWKEMNQVMSVNMDNALNWLDAELKAVHVSGRHFLVGGRLTAADIGMLFGLQLIYDRKLGLEHLENEGWGQWAAIETWMEYCLQEKSWLACVERTGFRMGGTL
jgi:glutathione S-transferase